MIKRAKTQAPTQCGVCNQDRCTCPVKPAIGIKHGDVRRGMRAANLAYEEARTEGVIANGVVLMTAILLVERLANSLNLEPLRVLQTMARCFEHKRQYADRLKHPN